MSQSQWPLVLYAIPPTGRWQTLRQAKPFPKNRVPPRTGLTYINRMSEQKSTEQKYRAPALEKGLDILELLAADKRPLTKSQISVKLGRSVSEIFRMLEVLEERGYVTTAPSNGQGFELTNKLFALGISKGPNRNLVAAALPAMQELSATVRQSCHLAIAVDAFIVVIARVEAPGNIGFSVGVGYSRPIAHSTSGIVLHAFGPESSRAYWQAARLEGEEPDVWQTFVARSEKAGKLGHIEMPSEYVSPVTDISFPIYGDSGVIAALTLPHIDGKNSLSVATCVTEAGLAARAISEKLGGGPTRSA